MDPYLFQSLPYDVVYQLLANLINTKGKTTRPRQVGTAAEAQPVLTAPSDTGSGGAGPGPGTGEFGPLEGQTKSLMGNVSMARSVASTLNSLLGLGIPGLGLIGVGAPLTAVNLASSIAKMLGMPSGYDPALGMPTASDIQSIADLQGAYAARTAADQAMADYADRVAAFSGPIAAEAWGPLAIADVIGEGYADPGAFGGFGSNSLAGAQGKEAGSQSTATTGGGRNETANSVGNPDSPFGNSGGTTGGASDTSGTADSTGGSKGTEGSDRKRGGVFRANRPKTERITWGERGTAPGGNSGETAIFIPDRMQLPGLQENEAIVRTALRRKLTDLLADRRARSTR